MTREQIAELRETLTTARETDEYLNPRDLLPAVSRLLDEREALLKVCKTAHQSMCQSICVLRERELFGGAEEVEELLAPIAAVIAKAESP